MTVLIGLLLLANAVPADPVVRIQPGTDPRRVEVRVTASKALLAGLPEGVLTQEQGEVRLRLVLIDGDTNRAGPAIFGAYERRGTTLRFTPRHPLTPGLRYRAVLHTRPGSSLTADYTVKPRASLGSSTRVEKVYPTSSELPANQLKFYLYFSRPMRESRSIFDQVRLLDDRGKAVADPWRRTELWSADGKRLTLWIHPGRIKKGVNLREDLGPVLEPERSYTLVVEKNLLDAEGQPLAEGFRKPFRTTKALRIVPAVEDWKRTTPGVATRDALVLTFPRPFDHALLQRFIQVRDERKKRVPGRLVVGADERSVSFHPELPWSGTAHEVVVDGRLEDLAGNTPEGLFDVDNEAPEAEAPRLTIAFQPEERKAKR